MYFSKQANNLEKVFLNRIKKDLMQNFRLKGVNVSKLKINMDLTGMKICLCVDEK
jgi:hypothetical protein